LAQDALDLMDALGIKTFSVIGHDWGARTAYALAAIAPERFERQSPHFSRLFAPRRVSLPPFERARAWWYQWFMSV
jgi:pimeloyl-ACP methyl ester carboxylesterase